LACKIVDRTKSYINRYNVHCRIRGGQSCGAGLCGSIDNIDGCKGGENCWGGSITIHKGVGGYTVIHKGASDGKRTTKGNGDREA
jgi:hypothetical protein